MHEAVRRDKRKAVKLLLKLGADWNATDHDGLNALHHAVSECRSKVVDILVRACL